MSDLLRSQASDTGPLEALAIGSGAATQSGLDRIHRAYLLARLALAQRWQGDAEAEEYRGQISDLMNRAAEDGRLYQTLKETHPYATAIGEAIPAFAMGRGVGGTTLRFNVARELAQDAAPQTISGWMTGLRAF